MKFLAEEPGHYATEIVMRGSDDTRVFKIECTVNPEGSAAELHFAAPVHQNVTQEIPLVYIVCKHLLYEEYVITFRARKFHLCYQPDKCFWMQDK